MHASKPSTHQPQLDLHGRGVTDASGPWVDYINAAVQRAGGVAALAERAGLSVATVSRWRNGRVAAEGVEIRSITAVANAIGDDPRNALRAAGQLDPEPRHDSTRGTRSGSLPDKIREIREEMQRISDLRLPPAVEADSMDELWRLLHDEISRYQRTEPVVASDEAQDGGEGRPYRAS